MSGLEFIVSSGSDRNFWVNVVNFLTTNEVVEATVEMKIRLLFWLCDEFMSTTKAKTFIETALDISTKIEKEQKGKMDSTAPDGEEQEIEQPEFSRSGRRTSHFNKDRVIRQKVQEEEEEEESKVVETTEAIDISRPRHDPIGTNLFYLFY